MATAGSGLAAEAPMQIERLTFVASTAGTTDILVRARSAVIDHAADKAELDAVHAAWTDEAGRPSLEIDCERGELDLVTNDLLAEGDVRGLLADGRRFEGPWLRYDRKRGVAFTRADVRIIEGERVLSGGGFEYHVRDGRLRLTSGASVREQLRR